MANDGVVRVLLVGGTHHVGRAVVEAALARGDEVTTVTRGLSGPPTPGARALHADRASAGEVAAVLGGADWDAVIDTWSGAPCAVRDAAGILAGRTGRYCYVSSRSVTSGRYRRMPMRARRSSMVTRRRRTTGTTRLPSAVVRWLRWLHWWLRRIERGGDVLAPGPRDLPLQYVDCRDLAAWLLHAADAGTGGVFNTVSEPGHTRMGGLLEAVKAATGSAARLVWVTPGVIEAAGIAP